jgi:outer membrane biosynthesis protein TonB
VPAPAETGAAADIEARADGNHEIVPPRLIDPVRLPSWAQPANQTSTNIIELDIAPTGSVRRVRLLSTPTRLTDMMILSAAKTWVFEPASSQGRAVPYKLTLNWVPPNR